MSELAHQPGSTAFAPSRTAYGLDLSKTSPDVGETGPTTQDNQAPFAKPDPSKADEAPVRFLGIRA